MKYGVEMGSGAMIRGGLISLWFYKDNKKLRD
jgi:hypothetical protein